MLFTDQLALAGQLEVYCYVSGSSIATEYGVPKTFILQYTLFGFNWQHDFIVTVEVLKT